LNNTKADAPIITNSGASPQRTYPVEAFEGENGTIKRPESKGGKRAAIRPSGRIIAVGPVFAVERSGLAVSILRS
tara:strand:+ start:3335 stop:3559 length:225 start_codon:yes stop_codon:yes gene_type:complete